MAGFQQWSFGARDQQWRCLGLLISCSAQILSNIAPWLSYANNANPLFM